jgi:hypothetical protein
MNTSQNQLASTGRQCMIMQFDALPKNEVFQVRRLQPGSIRPARIVQKLHRFQSTSAQGIQIYLALLCAGASGQARVCK